MSPRFLLVPSLIALSLACSSSNSSSSPASGIGPDGGPANGGNEDGGPGGGGTVTPLPATTFLFRRSTSASADSLVAYDLATKKERVITDLRGDGSEGWAITGFGIAPDRTRVVLAAPYAATVSDVATGLATPILWTLDVEGQSFQRLTPTFENKGGGKPGWRIDVRSPSFSLDGANVLYDFGQGTGGGYSEPFVVSSKGGALPSPFPVKGACSNLSDPSVNPKTGEVLITQGVCSSSDDAGLFLYPPNGGTPKRLVPDSPVSFSYETPRWSADGTILFYTGSDNSQVQSLYAYATSNDKSVVLVAGSATKKIRNATASPDGNTIVYCAEEASAFNLHVVDFSVEPAVDTALTTDGTSCDPVFF